MFSVTVMEGTVKVFMELNSGLIILSTAFQNEIAFLWK